LERFLSAHEQRFALALVRIPQVPLRDEFSAQIEQWCAEHRRPFIRFKLAGLTPDQVWQKIRSGTPAGTVAMLDDLDAAFHEPTGDLASLLNRQRERIAELLPGPVLLVLGEGAMNRLFVDAPDLADWHAATFEFESAPTARGPRAEASPIPERSAEWIESRIALLQDQLGGSSLRDRSRARILMELADLYRDSLYAVSSNPDHPRARSALEGMQLAESALREAVRLARRLAERDTAERSQRDLVRALTALARLLKDAGRYEDAEALVAEGLRICQREFGDEDSDTLVSVNNLATLYRDQGRYAEAEPLYLRARAAKERVLGSDHPSTLASVNNLAGLYVSQGRYAEAEALYLRARARERVLGSDHPSTLRSLNDLAALYEKEGRYAEAASLYQQGLAASERVQGSQHPDTLTMVHNLAGLFETLGRYAEAEALCQRALANRERVLGAEHPDTLATVNNLAALYQGQGRHAEAEQLYRRALSTSQHVLGNEHPNTLTTINNLAALYQDQGRYVDAEQLYRRALAARERMPASEHPSTLLAVSNLAALCENQERYAEAEQLYQRAITAAETAFGHDHPNAKLIRSNLEHLRSRMQTAQSSPSSAAAGPDSR
jgi:tetratricopeptide (TPR) repeat protein